MRKFKRKDETVDKDSEPVKKGRNKLVYGVNNNKWYEVMKDKDSVEQLKLASQVDLFEEREKIFNGNRAALMKLIRFFSVDFNRNLKVSLSMKEQPQDDLKGLCWIFF